MLGGSTVAVDNSGVVYVCDSHNNHVQILLFTTNTWLVVSVMYVGDPAYACSYSVCSFCYALVSYAYNGMVY